MWVTEEGQCPTKISTVNQKGSPWWTLYFSTLILFYWSTSVVTNPLTQASSVKEASQYGNHDKARGQATGSELVTKSHKEKTALDHTVWWSPCQKRWSLQKGELLQKLALWMMN